MNSKVSPIVPTVGRVVLVRGSSVRVDEPLREFPALVTRVWNDNCINVHVFNEEAGGKVITSVTFDDDEESIGYAAWRWMPYQVQAAKERDPVSGEKAQQDVLGHHGSVINSPAELRAESGLSFSTALYALKEGYRVSREGWNGKGMWLYHVPANSYPAQTEVAKRNLGEMVPYGAYLAMKTATGEVVPWLASQTDILAEDWQILGEVAA